MVCAWLPAQPTEQPGQALMLNGRVALVTGATGGLGPAVVSALLGAGASLVAVARSAAELEALRAGVEAPAARWLAHTADMSDPVAAQAAVTAAQAHFGRVEIAVAVAGGWRGGQSVAETDSATLDWLLRVNLLTAFNLCRAVLPGMLALRWGRIVTIGARATLGGQVGNGAYAASKAALLALTQSIAAETRSTGITANTLLLGTIDTPANRAAMPAADFTRWVAPEQIAAVIRFLCGEEAADISGAALPVYGRA
jgi:NAD(P)-dependent dehydrogenase (short-subunit alcohol dehydrogenase family)